MNNQNSPKAISRLALSGLALSVAVIISALMSGVGYRLGWWRHPEAFTLFEWATYAAIIALLISILGTFKTRPKSQKRGLLLGITGIVLSLPVISASVLFEYSASAYPRINDITTDTQDPPSFWDVPNPIEYPGQSVADLQLAAYPDIRSLELDVSPEKAFEKALEVVTKNDWEVIASDVDEGRIEAVDSTLLFGFKDEVVVRIAATDEGSIIDIRSRSRIGRIDRGANAKRIRRYLNALKQTTASL
jgi:uncharacterized protein (DUF1499 family)/multisubunit Na+/H+ antiporter MnhG subunit